jgi:hypothetical protein
MPCEADNQKRGHCEYDHRVAGLSSLGPRPLSDRDKIEMIGVVSTRLKGGPMRWLYRGLLVLALLAMACASGENLLGLENESEVQVDMPDIHRPLVPGQNQ